MQGQPLFSSQQLLYDPDGLGIMKMASLYFKDFWNKLDICAILVFVTGLTCRWVAEPGSSCSWGLTNQRENWRRVFNCNFFFQRPVRIFAAVRFTLASLSLLLAAFRSDVFHTTTLTLGKLADIADTTILILQCCVIRKKNPPSWH